MYTSRRLHISLQFDTFSLTEKTHNLTPRSEIECYMSSLQQIGLGTTDLTGDHKNLWDSKERRHLLGMGWDDEGIVFTHFMEDMTSKIGLERWQNLEMWTSGKFINSYSMRVKEDWQEINVMFGE